MGQMANRHVPDAIGSAIAFHTAEPNRKVPTSHPSPPRFRLAALDAGKRWRATTFFRERQRDSGRRGRKLKRASGVQKRASPKCDNLKGTEVGLWEIVMDVREERFWTVTASVRACCGDILMA